MSELGFLNNKEWTHDWEVLTYSRFLRVLHKGHALYSGLTPVAVANRRWPTVQNRGRDITDQAGSLRSRRRTLGHSKLKGPPSVNRNHGARFRNLSRSRSRRQQLRL